MRFEIRKSRKVWLKQRWYFVGVANNNEKIFTSEMYAEEASAWETIGLIQQKAAGAPIIPAEG